MAVGGAVTGGFRQENPFDVPMKGPKKRKRTTTVRTARTRRKLAVEPVQAQAEVATPDLYVRPKGRLEEQVAGAKQASPDYGKKEAFSNEWKRLSATQTLPGNTEGRNGGNITSGDANAMQEAQYAGPGTWADVKKGAANKAGAAAVKTAKAGGTIKQVANAGLRSAADYGYSAGGAALGGALGGLVGGPGGAAVGGTLGAELGPSAGHLAEKGISYGYGKAAKYFRVKKKHKMQAEARERQLKLPKKPSTDLSGKGPQSPVPPTPDRGGKPGFGDVESPFVVHSAATPSPPHTRSGKWYNYSPPQAKRRGRPPNKPRVDEGQNPDDGGGPPEQGEPGQPGPSPPAPAFNNAFGVQQPFVSQVHVGNTAWFDDLAPSGTPYVAKPRTVSTLAPEIRRPKGPGRWGIDPNTGMPFAGLRVTSKFRTPRAGPSLAQVVY